MRMMYYCCGEVLFSLRNDVLFQISAEVVISEPFKGCTSLSNAEELMHRIAVIERGECMFIDKVLMHHPGSDNPPSLPTPFNAILFQTPIVGWEKGFCRKANAKLTPLVQ